MIETKDIILLVEANKAMSRVIDCLYNALLQVATVDEIERMGILSDMSKAAEIMKDYD